MTTAQPFVLDPSLSGLELLQQWIAQGYVAGFNGRLRARPVAATPGHVRFECALDEGHENFVGLVHGGVAAALVDIVGGSVAMSLLEPGETLLTADLQLRYVRPARIGSGTMIGEGRASYHDRRRVIASVDVLADDELVAHGSVNISIRKPKDRL